VKVVNYLFILLKIITVRERSLNKLVLDSVRSDECIDFTMTCVVFFLNFFLSVYMISNRNNGSIFNLGILFDGKVILVGALES